ncbi:hypothetical protein Tco_1029517 [Tanacetum coccineum]|uniref:Reverse transcriptase domain-containing protein n=1 Tax=Tanacetum coccineum TaxID=301880 RepID=A0ABQ5G3N1_9ASTR
MAMILWTSGYSMVEKSKLDEDKEGSGVRSFTLLWLFKDGGGVKEFQRSFRHSDTERLSRSDEVLKLKNFKKDATLKLFKSTNQVREIKQGSQYVSRLEVKKCMADELLAIPLDEIQIDEKLHFIEEPIEIMDREVKRLKQSRISIFKVRWNSSRHPEFTWEREDQMQKKYPHLFTNSAPVAEVASQALRTNLL